MIAPATVGPVHAEPLTAGEFAAAIEVLAPASRFAVAVSGGSDSLALTLLAHEWAEARGGSVTALTIDHGLRDGSDAEAASVSGWMANTNITHKTLRWNGPRPDSGMQAAAREARFSLLTDWCRSHNVCDLLLGHHRDDQAETFLFRLARGSGPRGLAAMSAVSEQAGVRILRPLLVFPKARLEATLKFRGQPWVHDPSNTDRRFARVRARTAITQIPCLNDAVESRGRARAGMDTLSAALLGRVARFEPAGFCRVDHAKLRFAPLEIATAALTRVLTAVGGRSAPPETRAVARLLARLVKGLSGTLHGVTLIPSGSEMLAVRETRNLDESPLFPGESRIWDGRFLVGLDRGPAGTVSSLGEEGWRMIRTGASTQLLRKVRLPYPVRRTLPTLWAGGQPVSVPHLGLNALDTGFSATFLGVELDSRFAVASLSR